MSGFGSQVTMFAVAVLVVTTLDGSPADVGLVTAARWLPYLLLGLVVGALADRVRRKPLLVGTDLTRAALLAAVPLLELGFSAVESGLTLAAAGVGGLLGSALTLAAIPFRHT